MRPKAEIARLKARVVQLEAQLQTLGAEPLPEFPPWAAGLCRQEVELMTMLARAYPRALDAFAIDERLTHHDHAADRDVRKLANILAFTTRKKIGQAAIETLRGRGYRAGASFMAALGTQGEQRP